MISTPLVLSRGEDPSLWQHWPEGWHEILNPTQLPCSVQLERQADKLTAKQINSKYSCMCFHAHKTQLSISWAENPYCDKSTVTSNSFLFKNVCSALLVLTSRTVSRAILPWPQGLPPQFISLNSHILQGGLWLHSRSNWPYHSSVLRGHPRSWLPG